MSDDWGFAAPPFDPAQALLQLQRAMRDCKLAARGTGFELRGKAVVSWRSKAVRSPRGWCVALPARPSGIATP